MANVSEAHENRRAEFLHTAQELFFENGYDDTPVNAILERMGVAKGTFYHYFASKEDLLDQMVESLSDQGMIVIDAELQIPGPSAIEQISRVFNKITSWKADQKDVMLILLHAMYRDENLLLRRKMFRRSAKLMTPVIATIIRRGIKSGEMTTKYPDETAELIMEMGFIINAKIARIILAHDHSSDAYPQVLHWLTIYERKAEKMMGAPHESLNMFNRDDVRAILS